MIQKRLLTLFVVGCVVINSVSQVSPKVEQKQIETASNDSVVVDSIQLMHKELQAELKRAIRQTPN